MSQVGPRVLCVRTIINQDQILFSTLSGQLLSLCLGVTFLEPGFTVEIWLLLQHIQTTDDLRHLYRASWCQSGRQLTEEIVWQGTI